MLKTSKVSAERALQTVYRLLI